MQRTKARNAGRAIAWLVIAAVYMTVLVIASDLAGTPVSGASSTAVGSVRLTDGAVDAAADTATTVAQRVAESPLATLLVASVLLALIGAAFLVTVVRRRLASRRAASAEAMARRASTGRRSSRVTIPT